MFSMSDEIKKRIESLESGLELFESPELKIIMRGQIEMLKLLLEEYYSEVLTFERANEMYNIVCTEVDRLQRAVTVKYGMEDLYV